MEIRMQSEAQVRVQAVDKHAGELGNRSNTAPEGEEFQGGKWPTVPSRAERQVMYAHRNWQYDVRGTVGERQMCNEK